MTEYDRPVQIGRHWVFSDGTRLPVVSGGSDEATPVEGEETAPAEHTPDLSGLSEAALRARHAELVARIGTIEANKERTLADSRERVRLTAEANEIAGLVGEMNTDSPLTELPTAPAAPVQKEEVEHFVEGQEEEAAEAIAAAADVARQVQVHGQPADAVQSPETPALCASMVAAASHGAVTAGVEVDLGTVGQMVRQLAHNPGRIGQNEALIEIRKPFDPVLTAAAGAAANTRALAAALADESLQASLDACGPPDVLRDVPECLNTSRYVDGWFRTIPAAHGEIQYYRPFGLSDVSGAVAVWDETDQDAVDADDPDTWKPCVEIGCLPTVTVGVDAVTECMTMRVFDVMTSPEAVGSALQALRALMARTADGHLLDLYDAQASLYRFDASQARPTVDVGSTVDLYDLVGRLLGAVAAANRDVDAGDYTLAVEAGLLGHLGLDVVSACNPRPASEDAQSLLSSLGIGNIVVTPDWSLTDGAGPFSPYLPINAPGNAAVVVPARPTTWKIRMFAPADWAMLSPGVEQLGVVPDLANKRQNKVTWFGEIWEGLAKIGCRPAFTVQVTALDSSGIRAGCATPDAAFS